MRVTVFGGTGAIGREVVADLLFRGHEVVAFVPSLGQVPEDWGVSVDVVVGGLTDAAAVDAAVARAEAVINVLRPGRDHRGEALVKATATIVASMEAHRVHRYIGHGNPAVTRSTLERPTTLVSVHRLLTRCLRPCAYQQQTAISDVVTGSALDWTIVRYLHARPGTSRGLKAVGFFGRDSIGTSAVGADIARFTVTQVLDTAYIGAAPAVSN